MSLPKPTNNMELYLYYLVTQNSGTAGTSDYKLELTDSALNLKRDAVVVSSVDLVNKSDVDDFINSL